MTHEKKKKPPKKKVRVSEFPQCQEARYALIKSDNVYKMASESSRARLINHVVEEYLPTGREYTSFFRLSVTRDPNEPPLLLTPPTRDPLCDPARRTTEVYPSMLPSLRWVPEAATSTDSAYFPVDNLKYNCRCQQCKSPECPSKSRSPPEEQCLNPSTAITKYIDRQTMTPKYNDASCGICKGINYVPKTCDAAVVASVTTLREPRVYFEECPAPPSVYVKRCDKYPNCGILIDVQKQYDLTGSEQRAVRDTDEQRYHWSPPGNPAQARCSTQQEGRLANCTDEQRRGWTDVGRQSVVPATRRLLYNEGITDSETEFLPNKRSPSYHTRDRSRDSRRSYKIDGYIPFSHTSKSKYHHDCKRNDHWKPAYIELGADSMPSSKTTMPYTDIRVPLAAAGRAGVVACRPCGLPRKLLMSEKVIDSYINCTWKKAKRKSCLT